MALFNSLKEAATKLGLLQIATVDDIAQPARITTRSISLQELTTQLRAAEVSALAAAPSEFTVPFDHIFTTAGIQPPPVPAGKQPWTIDTLHKLVIDAPYKDLPREKAQQALLAALAAQEVSVESLVKDAIARDKAIDAYATGIFQKRQDRRRALLNKSLELQSQIAALKSQLDRLAEEDKAADQLWNQWWQRKLAYERQMAMALSYLLETPIVTIDAQLPPDHNRD